MKVSNKVYLALFTIATIVLSSVIKANPDSSDKLITVAEAQDPSESVLSPGAKLLAGDPNKNEFYILGKDETAPRQVMQVADNSRESAQRIGGAVADAINNPKKSHIPLQQNMAQKSKKTHMKPVTLVANDIKAALHKKHHARLAVNKRAKANKVALKRKARKHTTV